MFFLSFIIISLAPALFNAAPISPLPPETPVNNPPTVHFWITTEILNVDWTPKCLTTAYCDEPELKITQTNTWNGEKSSFSWVLNENFEQVSDSISQEINEQLLLLCALLGAILLCTCITLLGFCIWKCKSKQKKPKAKSPTVIVHSPSWDHDHFV
ncbi:unnamed protein product [Gongylonema pulchrum]|uniref:E3 CR1-beta n=1 Tax=Gongylonema pulchrum TaxID=637853 RepID=A0A183E7M5_9BILA|nr:unnamed protein product [Gongylonema pulchrum]